MRTHKDVSLVVLDGDAPLQFQPWGSYPLQRYVSGFKKFEPWISDYLKAYDSYRFEVLFDTPGQLRERDGGWVRIVGAVVDVAHASRDPAAAVRISSLLRHVCTSLVTQASQPWFRKVGFHLVSLYATREPTVSEVTFRDELIDLIEHELQLHATRGLECYEAGDPDAFLREMRHSTTAMVRHNRYWERFVKPTLPHQPA